MHREMPASSDLEVNVTELERILVACLRAILSLPAIYVAP
jgi:hypothetical protein